MLYVKLTKPDAKQPIKRYDGDAGYDIFPCETVLVKAGKSETISTGLHVQFVPDDSLPFYIRVAPRSGLAKNHGINVLAGVVDCRYVGEIMVIVHNTSDTNFIVKPSQAIAQLIPTKIYDTPIKQVDSLDNLPKPKVLKEETNTNTNNTINTNTLNELDKVVKKPRKPRAKKGFGSTDAVETMETETEESKE